MKKYLRGFLARFDISVVRSSNLSELAAKGRGASDIAFLARLPDEQVAPLLRLLGKSKSQLRQDLFVLSQVGLKRNGYFVEFGATNGIDLSNSYLLEQEFGWRGILAEPGISWHSALRKNRVAHIDTRCVWSESNITLNFNESEVAEFSTVEQFSNNDDHGALRSSGQRYEVKTVTLAELLQEHNAPAMIDYLSIDTEGSEFEILNAFDFEKYKFSVITCEHNYTPMREKLSALLAAAGYKRIYEDISMFDDWYVRRGINVDSHAS